MSEDLIRALSDWLGGKPYARGMSRRRRDALAVAEAATEAARALLFRAGADLASASCVHESLRRQRSQAWGELGVDTRMYLVG